MTTIHLEGRDILPALRGNYQGNKFRLEVCETVTIPADAGLWSGGSRDHWYAVEFSTGREMAFPGQQFSPWNDERKSRQVKLEPGFVVICHTMFQGKDLGLHIYLHPDNASKLLPAAPAALSELEQRVLNATARLKSSYGGKDRYQMDTDYDRSMGRAVPSRQEWEATKSVLISMGLLDKRGAITVKGRNAVKR